MTLTAGGKLGAFEILSPIGKGGMGEVYRARDTNLGRDVAVKVLPDAFAHDADRLARFQREAQVLASLNHPNIAQIYGLEPSARAAWAVSSHPDREGSTTRTPAGGGSKCRRLKVSNVSAFAWLAHLAITAS